MNHIPVEIARLIFSFLSTRDKLECMTVCQQWGDIIQHHSLFCNIEIDNQPQLNKLIDKIKVDPTLGLKVEKLEVSFILDVDLDETIFPALFPNLRNFTSAIYNGVDRDWKSVIQLQNHPWTEHIEIILDCESDVNTRMLLYSGLCKNLNTIVIWGTALEPELEPCRHIIEKLNNAPALRTLKLNTYKISFQDLELLHKTVPLLKSLSLCFIAFNGTPNFRNIIPATSLNSFSCTVAWSPELDSFNVYLPYICKKYTHLEELELELHHLHPMENDTDALVQQTALNKSYLKNILGPRLKTLSIILYSGNDRMIEEFYISILNECRSQLSSLTWISDLDITSLQQLGESVQVQYIQSLKIDRLKVDDNGFVSLEWLKNFTNLKALSLYFPMVYGINKGYEFQLMDLREKLNGNPLETLELENIRCKPGDIHTNLVYPSLKNLTLSNVSFDSGSDVYLSQLFPNLKCLRLYGCFDKGGSFTLPKIDLSYLEIINYNVRRSFSILVVSLRNDQQRFYYESESPRLYLPDKKQTRGYSFTLRSKAFDRTKDFPMMTIVCNYVYSCNMINEEN